MGMETVDRKKSNDPHSPSEVILGSKLFRHVDVAVLSPVDRQHFLHFQYTGSGCSYSLLSMQPFQCFAVCSSLLLFKSYAPRLPIISEVCPFHKDSALSF